MHRDASNRLTYDMAHVAVRDYAAVCKELVERCRLVPLEKEIEGPDEIFRDYSRDDATVGLEWDCWSGFTVVAKDARSDPLAREIATYLARSRWVAR